MLNNVGNDIMIKTVDNATCNIIKLKSKDRIVSIDAIRGIAMVFMALDHTREFLLASPVEPTDIDHAGILLFLTRFITNFCAPIFVLLVGTSMNLSIQNGTDKKYIAKFLFTRGVWLCLTEFTIVHFVWTFELIPSVVDLQTMYALGISMMVLSVFIFLPNMITLIVGIIMVISHNLLDFNDAQILGNFKFLHLSYLSKISPGFSIWFDYPVIPWVGVAFIGYVMGNLWKYPSLIRKNFFMLAGGLLLALFIVFRYLNGYGDPSKWVSYSSSYKTIESFLNISKYPPSMLFLFLTVGVVFIIFCLLDNAKNKFLDILSVFGRVPFFFYVFHIFLIHCFAVFLAYIRGRNDDLYFNINIYNFFDQPSYLLKTGMSSLASIYLVWVVILIVMYELSRRYGRFKAAHKSNIILSYL